MRISKFRVRRGRRAGLIERCAAAFSTRRRPLRTRTRPTGATTNQLFGGAIANILGSQEGPVAMNICEWMQQCAGIGGRFVDTQGTYAIDS